LRRSWWALAGESARVAAATSVVSGLVGLLAVVVPAVALGISGLNIEGQAAILRRVDEVGARTMTMTTSETDGGIPATAVDRIARLQGVEWVVGLGPVFDVRNREHAGAPTPVRSYRAVGAPVLFSSLSGETGAFVSTTSSVRVGLGGAYSELDPGDIQVVGWFRAEEPLTRLEAFILIPNTDDRLRLERIIVAVHDVGWVDLVAGNLPAMVGAQAAQASTIERSPALLEARDAVRDEVTRRDRVLVVAVLSVAMALGCVVVFAGTVAGRRDFGRRRALGATQQQLTLLVMLGTLWPAVIGASIGTALGSAYLGSRLGHLPDWRFPVSLAILTVLGLVAASALPAAVAATRDPLRVLRLA
jgi:putative ABC transport system permease protein